MSEFNEFFTNPDYIGGYNAILSGNKDDRNKGIVYVEDDADVWFWRKLIEQHFPNEYEYKTASKNGQGKIALRQFYDRLNKKVLIARDADYDWIFSGQDDLENPYILHTFAYGKESVLIEKYTLGQFFKGISHTYCHQVVMQDVLDKFSELVFVGLCYLTDFYLKNNSISTINLDNFNKNYHLLDKNFILDDLNFNSSLFDDLKTKICNDFKLSNNQMIIAKNYLSKYCIFPNNAYRFISGHLLDDFISNIHKQLCNQLKNKEMKEIRNNFEGKAISERQKQLRHIFQSNFSLETYYRQYLIDNNDEIHQKILEKIARLNH